MPTESLVIGKKRMVVLVVKSVNETIEGSVPEEVYTAEIAIVWQLFASEMAGRVYRVT